MRTLRGINYKGIKNVNLTVYLHSLSETHYDINLNPNSGKVFSTTPEIFPETELLELTFDKYNGNLLRSGQDSFDTFNFVYDLRYSSVSDVENIYVVRGNATTKSPIKCMDYVTQTNVSINKSLLRLTGILIILGSISFIVSLRQLVNKKQP